MTTKEKTEFRKNWRHRWLGLLFEFSHVEYQKGLWFDHIYSDEIGWFKEDICKYFDDLNLDDHYKHQLENSIISTQEYSIIKTFHFELNKFVQMTNEFEDTFNEDEILENKDWLRVCEIGLAAWHQLKLVISSPTEKEHMIGLEQNYLTGNS